MKKYSSHIRNFQIYLIILQIFELDRLYYSINNIKKKEEEEEITSASKLLNDTVLHSRLT